MSPTGTSSWCLWLGQRSLDVLNLIHFQTTASRFFEWLIGIAEWKRREQWWRPASLHWTVKLWSSFHSNIQRYSRPFFSTVGPEIFIASGPASRVQFFGQIMSFRYISFNLPHHQVCVFQLATMDHSFYNTLEEDASTGLNYSTTFPLPTKNQWPKLLCWIQAVKRQKVNLEALPPLGHGLLNREEVGPVVVVIQTVILLNSLKLCQLKSHDIGFAGVLQNTLLVILH